ncbi:MAG: hypothetical protein QG639_179 [Patescibacteria group bacterium]|nr:hypothetical protein [Patescibacteria group bacterium]
MPLAYLRLNYTCTWRDEQIYLIIGGLILLGSLSLSSLFLIAKLALKRVLSKNSSKIISWTLIWGITYILVSYIYTYAIGEIRIFSNNTLRSISTEILEYEQANNTFPVTLADAQIKDYVFLDIPLFKIHYALTNMEDFPDVKYASMNFLTNELNVHSAEYDPYDYYDDTTIPITPGCGW